MPGTAGGGGGCALRQVREAATATREATCKEDSRLCDFPKTPAVRGRAGGSPVAAATQAAGEGRKARSSHTQDGGAGAPGGGGATSPCRPRYPRQRSPERPRPVSPPRGASATHAPHLGRVPRAAEAGQEAEPRE
jgi:hypothetical protein